MTSLLPKRQPSSRVRWGNGTTVLVLLAAVVLVVVLLTSADSRARSLLRNTLLLAAGTCALSVPFGTVLALTLVKTNLPGRRWVALGLGLLLFVPLYLQCAAWQAGFGLQGWWTMACLKGAWLQGWRGAIWVHAVAAVPWATMIVGAGLRLVEPELEEQALLDGSPRQVFHRVTLRRAAPAMVIATLWIAVATAGEMTVTDLMQIRTFAEEVYTDFAAASSLDEGPAPLALSAVLTALLIVVGMVTCAGLAPARRGPSLQSPWRLPLGVCRWPAACAAGATVVVLLGLPLAHLAYKAGTVVARVGDQRVRSWSCAKCVAMVVGSPGRHRRELQWSLIIALSAAVTALIVAVLLAWLARAGGARRLPLLAAASLALAIPGPVLGVAIIWVLNQRQFPPLVWLYDRSILAPWLAQTVRALPLPILIMWHALATVPADTLDSATVEGARWPTRLVRVALPTRLPALAASGLVALVLALGELSATVLVVPPGMSTLPVRIFGLLHYGVEDQVAGICLALVALIAAVTGLVWAAAALVGRRMEAR